MRENSATPSPELTAAIRSATTWRDLIPHLTAKQINELEYCEQSQVPGIHEPDRMLNGARAHVHDNVIQTAFADIPNPTDAVDTPSPWEEWGESFGRMYSAAPTQTSDVRMVRDQPVWQVHVFGVQFVDGHVERNVTALVHDEPMTSAEARRLATAINNAADALDGLEA